MKSVFGKFTAILVALLFMASMTVIVKAQDVCIGLQENISESNSINESVERAFSCVHLGNFEFIDASRQYVGVKVTHIVTGEIGLIPCFETMRYTLQYQVVYPDGSIDNAGEHQGAIGRYGFETWDFGGKFGQTLRCRLITTTHGYTAVGEWGEFKFF